MISGIYPSNMVAEGRHNTHSSVKALARDPAWLPIFGTTIPLGYLGRGKGAPGFVA